MKALNCKLKLILAVLLFAGTGIFAQDVKKELHEEFDTNKSTVLEIDSKFTELTVNSWGKDLLVVDVTITVKDSDEGKAKKLLGQINVDIEKNGNNISIETDFDDSFSKGVKKIAKGFTVEIEVNAPSYINLDIEAKFGSSELGSFTGNADISTSFGAMEIEKLSGQEIYLTVNQGDCSVGEIADAVAEVNFGVLNLISAANLDIEVNQGEAVIGRAKNLSAEVQMGSLVVKKVDQSFEEISIENDMSNTVLGIDENAGFTIEIEMNMGGIDIPRSLGEVKTDKKGLNSSFEGTYGNGKSSISLEGRMGQFELKFK